MTKHPSPPPERPERRRSLRGNALSLGGVVLFALLFRTFVAEANVIPSSSMQPALLPGDRILVLRFVYGLKLPFVEVKLTSGRLPHPGEMVVFVHPQSGETLVKRAVAVSGDTVALREGVPWVNGQPVPRRAIGGRCTYVDQADLDDLPLPRRCNAFEERLGGERYLVYQAPESAGFEMPARTVPEGHVFVLGDNRDNSNDSRYWGTVPRTHLKGRALIHLWSYGEPEGVRWSRFFTLIHRGSGL